MNGLSADLAQARAIDALAGRLPQVEVGITPAATLLAAMAQTCEHLLLGGQNCHHQPAGAYTGEISAAMLADAGADFTIVGHSERRAMYGESDSDVSCKAQAALASGLRPIICVGETEAQRASGLARHVVMGQLAGSLPKGADAARICVAYEPVWAVGTGHVPSVEQIGEIHVAIRSLLIENYGAAGQGVRILYGGSVNAENAARLLAAPEVGGALVGGASLTIERFAGVIEAAAHLVAQAAA